jgi:hypothetical protein
MPLKLIRLGNIIILSLYLYKLTKMDKTKQIKIKKLVDNIEAKIFYQNPDRDGVRMLLYNLINQVQEILK